MKVPFVSFKPMEKELDKDLREAFDRVYTRSWYIEGVEDESFEEAFANYCDRKYCVGTGNGLDALMLALKEEQKQLCQFIYMVSLVIWIQLWRLQKNTIYM